MTDPRRNVPAPPLGRSASSPTEILSRDAGPSIRRIRKLRVEVLSGPSGVGETFTFAQDEIRVGTDAECDVRLADPAVSREHAAVRLGEAGWSIADLGSTNGTWVGELRLGAVTFVGRTILDVGKTRLALVPLSETVDQELSPRPAFGRMLGASAPMRQVFALLEKVAASELTVLVEGETGTGKELAAEGLHEASDREGRFVAVNCGAIPRELVESELFGHRKGAFTGAVSDRPGAFVAADKGTLFLDEVGELPLDVQAKLLRALERREVKPVGSDEVRRVDVRIVAATNRSLAREVEANRFRQDLFYRLAVVVVRIPPLRTRLEDVRLLVDHFQEELARRRAAKGLPPHPRLDEPSLAMLLRYDFPGNVRELKNVVERWAVLGAPPAELAAVEAPAAPSPAPSSAPDDATLALPYHEAKDAWIERFERAFVEHALETSGGNVSKAARDAGVDRRHLQRLMARFGVKAKE